MITHQLNKVTFNDKYGILRTQLSKNVVLKSGNSTKQLSENKDAEAVGILIILLILISFKQVLNNIRIYYYRETNNAFRSRTKRKPSFE